MLKKSKTSTVKSRALISSLEPHLGIYEEETVCLCTVTFWVKVDFQISNTH